MIKYTISVQRSKMDSKCLREVFYEKELIELYALNEEIGEVVLTAQWKYLCSLSTL